MARPVAKQGLLDERISGVLVSARSVGGIATTITFPEFDLTVDLGFCTPKALRTRTIAFTHTHADHICGLHMYLAVRRLFGMAPPTLLVPSQRIEALRSFVSIIGALQGKEFEASIEGLEAGHDVPIGKSLFVHPFGVCHTVPTLGFSIVRRQKKLKEEYLGLSGAEVVGLRRELGDAIFRTVEEPLVAITGDTLAEAIPFDDPLVRDARVLFVEATFVDERRDMERVRAGAHVLLREVIPRLEESKAETIVLYHFSQIYQAEEVEALVSERLPEDLARRTILLLPMDGDRL